MTMDYIRIASYNSTGLSDLKIEYVQNFIAKNNIDIMFLQETWLLPTNIQRLGLIHKDYQYCAVSGVRDNELLRGRPYGGAAIMWHNSLTKYVTRLREIRSKRLCGVILDSGKSKLLMLNCYLPCDNFSKSNASHNFY